MSLVCVFRLHTTRLSPRPEFHHDKRSFDILFYEIPYSGRDIAAVHVSVLAWCFYYYYIIINSIQKGIEDNIRSKSIVSMHHCNLLFAREPLDILLKNK